jgi:hypothetical protein
MINEIKYLYPNAEPEIDFGLRDDSDGNGPYIHYWDTAKLGVQPTATELDEVKTLASVKPKLKAIETACEQHMDTVAQADGWDDRWSVTTRASYPNQYQAKGIAFGQWMDDCWVLILQANLAIEAGTGTIPTVDEAIAELPVMVWPV